MPINVNIKKKIVINGQTYNSIDEMPEDARRLYESMMSRFDKNGDGIPDALQNGRPSPQEARQMLENIRSAIDENRDGISNTLRTSQADPLDITPAESSAPALSPLGVQNSVIEPESGNTWLVVVSVVVILFLFMLGALVVFQFLR